MKYLAFILLLSGCQFSCEFHSKPTHCNLDAGVCEKQHKDMKQQKDDELVKAMFLYNIMNMD